MTSPSSTSNIIPLSTLCLTGDRNSPSKRADFTGAFLPECKAFMKHHGIPSENHHKVNLGNLESKRYEELKMFIHERCKALGKAPTALAIWCHGLKNKIQLGINVSNVVDFAKFLRRMHHDYNGSLYFSEMVVVLYACSTGNGPGLGGDGGFADKLRDALCAEGFVNCRVYGHETSGHTVRNPNKKLFEGKGSLTGGTGGVWVVSPTDKNLFKKWQTELKKDTSSLRYRYGFMTISEVLHEISK